MLPDHENTAHPVISPGGVLGDRETALLYPTSGKFPGTGISGTLEIPAHAAFGFGIEDFCFRFFAFPPQWPTTHGPYRLPEA